MEFVYIVKFSDCIKIGYTTNIKKRFSSIETSSGREILDKYYVYGNRKLEKLMHEIYKNHRFSKGEFFKVSFDDAVSTLKRLTTKKEQKINPILEKYNNGTYSEKDVIHHIRTEKIRFIDAIHILESLNYDIVFKNRVTGNEF